MNLGLPAKSQPPRAIAAAIPTTPATLADTYAPSANAGAAWR